ncbi:MAG: hypothetical protein LBD76_05235 [Prevotellaceae bacterium]|jgi:hypothetical protein|nr:hypothetical protein [Prevotellaceae bacterium]
MEKKILFLDIDGVLQPGGSQKRFDHIKDIDTLYKELFDKYGVDYSSYFKYDVAAVYYDWDKESIRELRRILDTTGAKIVISSDWRQSKPISCLQNFFRIYDMADYVIDYTPDFDYKVYEKLRQTDEYKEMYERRCIEILEYLKAHPEIKKWVALDDLSLDYYLKNNAVVTSTYKLVKVDADKCIEILGVADASD